MELCEGLKISQSTEITCAKYIEQIAKALNYLHNLLPPIVHRDIKPENILMDSIDDLYVKLTDFGFSTYFRPGEGMS